MKVKVAKFALKKVPEFLTGLYYIAIMLFAGIMALQTTNLAIIFGSIAGVIGFFLALYLAEELVWLATKVRNGGRYV